ncbi:MAG: glycosyltransferase N-terminal domain-containing protein, partial [Chitinophagales bacterium]
QKAKSWVKGRVGWRDEIQKISSDKRDKIWIHCASLGEYEMAVPLMQQLKNRYPQKAVVLSFFSPSGFQYCAEATHFDYKIYLPIDSPKNARFFVEKINPKVAVFVKYELWYYYLSELNRKDIPVFLINAQWSGNAVFFKWYGVLHREMLQYFKHVFVNDGQTMELASEILPADKISLSVDSRIERVLAIKNQSYKISDFENFRQESKILISGSSYLDEENVLLEFLNNHAASSKCIIAPHNINRERIASIERQFERYKPLLLSKWESYSAEDRKDSKVLVVDSIGQLSRIYRYADLAIVGGGFRGALHNAYEPLVYEIPVFFGADFGGVANWQKLLDQGLAFTFETSADFEEKANQFLKVEHNEQLKTKVQLFWEQEKKSENTVLEEIQKFI